MRNDFFGTVAGGSAKRGGSFTMADAGIARSHSHDIDDAGTLAQRYVGDLEWAGETIAA